MDAPNRSEAVVPVVVVHGGAGRVPPARREAHAEGCRKAALAGLRVLEAGGSALDAVVAAVETLEDDPIFNAGNGACLDAEGRIRLDASVMEGSGLRAGGVASLPPFRHPVAIARRVLEEGRHVLFVSEEAARWAEAHGFEPSTLEAMRTQAAVEQLERFRAGQAVEEWAGDTVGAVACDAAGRLAAATSTGGTVGKLPGRVGDTPIVGAGTYADDLLGACSTTGLGETIIRAVLARDAVDRLRDGTEPQAAAEAAIARLAERVDGRAGLILVDRRGRVGMHWNTQTMSHAVARAGEPVQAGC